MKLAIGFINYNQSSSPYLPYFLESLEQALKFANLEDYLVLSFDNSDQDFKENEKIIDTFLSKNNNFKLRKINNSENVGFARAYNIMIKEAVYLSFDFFLVLNPDIILNEDSIALLINEIYQNKDLAAIAPRIMFWDFKNLVKTEVIDSLGIGMKNPLNFFDIGQGEKYLKDVDYKERVDKVIAPSGAAGIYRLSLLKNISQRNGVFFDERFFMYKEDCDLAYRMHIAGLKSRTLMEAVFYHDRTTSSFGLGFLGSIFFRYKKSKRARAWSFRNQHFIYIKHFNSQNFTSKFLIIIKMLLFFFFSLILEQYLLKEYSKIIAFAREEKRLK